MNKHILVTALCLIVMLVVSCSAPSYGVYAKKADQEWVDTVQARYRPFTGVKLGEDALYWLDTFYIEKKYLVVKYEAIDYPNSGERFAFGSKKAYIDPGEIQAVSSSFDGNFYCTTTKAASCDTTGVLKIKLRGEPTAYFLIGRMADGELAGLADLLEVRKTKPVRHKRR